jgi:predicted negative regulator of RcsB-dependent stress response
LTLRAAFLSCLPLFLAGSSVLAADVTRPARAAENQFDVSITLFSTMAAINAAGYDVDLNSAANYPIRNQIREELAKRNVPALAELRQFYQEHRKGTDTATLSQYISFALLAGGPPGFKLDEGDLPPDVQPLIGFSAILSRFYKEANLEDLWARSQNAYLAAIQRYQDPVVNALLEANAYLRNPTSGATGRGFQIYLSLLASPNQVQVRSYKGDYFVVITPAYEPLVNQLRAAYLSYLLDPLSLRYSRDIDTKKDLQKFAEEAPALEEAYKNDFSLLVTKCLIKAVESRLMHGAENRQAYVDEAMREGYVLTAAFADLLPYYEKQPEAMRLYYPDLINAVDVDKERKRLKKVEFVQSIPQKVIVPPPSAQQASQADQTLEQAESLYTQHDFANARKLFQKVLQETDNNRFHGEAYYGLARVAVQERHADQATALFQKVVDLNPNPQLVAWSHVYLGRLAMLHEDVKTATDQFKQALAIDGASAKARDAAQNDLAKVAGDQQQ